MSVGAVENMTRFVAVPSADPEVKSRKPPVLTVRVVKLNCVVPPLFVRLMTDWPEPTVRVLPAVPSVEPAELPMRLTLPPLRANGLLPSRSAVAGLPPTLLSNVRIAP